MQIQLPKLVKIDPNKPIDTRKKILLLSDDLRFQSGIATMSRELVLGTADRFRWVQLAAALQHPEHGKIIDLSESIKKDRGIENADVKLFCHTTYGSIPVLREILQHENPDAIMLFTDPRHWMWFWPFEHELKTKYKIPLVYLSIWDNFPVSVWNSSFYASCDLLMGISRQSHENHKSVLDYHQTSWIDLDRQN